MTTENVESETDVLISGGGMIGLTLGIALAGAGIRVVLVDRAEPGHQLAAEFDGRASAIAFAQTELYRALDLWPALAPDAQPILEIRVSDQGSPLFLHYDNQDLGEGPLGQMVENRHIRLVLDQAARAVDGLTILAPDEIADASRTDTGVTARLRSGTTLRARLLVAAEGRHSRLRDEAGFRLARFPYKQSGIVATVAHEVSHQGIAHERFLASGPFAILPLTDNRVSLVWTERDDMVETIMNLGPRGFNAEVAKRIGGFLGRTEVVGPRWSYPISLQFATAFTCPRMVLVGDTAHGIHPIAGQGLNLGLRDVAALAEVLVDAHDNGTDLGDARVLARYQRWRSTDTAAMVAVTDSLNRLFSNNITPLKIARDIGLAAVNALPPLKRLFMRHARGTVGDLPKLLRGEKLG